MDKSLIVAVILLSSSVISLGQGELGTLKWYANQAKSRGQTSITVQANVLPVRPPTIEMLVQQRLAIDGTVESVIRNTYDEYHIYAWYRIKVLSHGTVPTFPGEKREVSIPQELSDTRSDEIVVRLPGGTATIDGVTITMIDGPDLAVGNRYLFFLMALNDKAFRLAPESLPIPLTDSGQFQANLKSPFAEQLTHYNSAKDLLDSSRSH